MDNVCAVILAAGEGKRMKSKHPKVIHKLCGKPIIQHVVDSVTGAGISDIIVVIGHKAEEVKECVESDVDFALQEKQLGTGHAVMCASDLIKERNGNGTTLILYGDSPLIKSETLCSLISYHRNNGFHGTVLTTEYDDPAGYGRVIRDSRGNVERIVEQKDATDEEKKVRECNSGIYCFETEKLLDALKLIKNDNAQKEYYLTDVIGAMKGLGLTIGAYSISDSTETVGINSRIQLADAASIMRRNIVNKLMLDGVTIINPESVYIDKDVSIGMDTVIYPGAIIEGKTTIGEDCIIGPNTRIVDSIIEDGADINSSVILESSVKAKAKIGPFAYIRPQSVIGEGAKIGDFVEVKKSVIGNGTKASHLTYIGDAEVGKNVNFGCGTITVNYDGNTKYKTLIGDNVFIGCNTNLVAPVKVNDNSYIAAGSTITDEVPEGALAIARERQTNKEGWAKKRNLYRKNK
ncbi:MAG TPA: bifunctional UDP-N-acetylglucosamine diphosphorylase/glucosamine-1-phosphate N-acetyltransferase GlmU [Clostridiaceae bacterium]|mgnify:CR=1 FL=1|nr:bifunctional UDP-N-acetylglucosamine diphosphorylase/glucosamine-1-phosphate N-acetyltransferase GlmU [Clostridiaceae bacterium]